MHTTPPPTHKKNQTPAFAPERLKTTTNKKKHQRSIFNGYAMYISPEMLASMPALTVELDNNVTIAIPSTQYTQVGGLCGRFALALVLALDTRS